MVPILIFEPHIENLEITAIHLGNSITGGDILERVQPEFPREADKAGVNDGKVKARMTVDASGEVTRVEVLEATPRRIFDREVVRALSQWRFAKGGDARAMEVDLEFRR